MIWRIGLGVLALALAAACSGGRTCNATNCDGCCDAIGVCHMSSASSCGEQGITCRECSSMQSCVLGACIDGVGGGSGAGGGSSGTGGGSSGVGGGSSGVGGGSSGTGGGTAAPKANVMLLFDKSGSMSAALPSGTNCGACSFPSCPEATCPTRMGAARAGLATFLATHGTAARLGLTIYPADAACGAAGAPQQLVAISPASDSASDLQALADSVNTRAQQLMPLGGTPTGPSLSFVGTISALNGTRDDYVVLLTDGLPNCNATNPNTCVQPSLCRCTLAGGMCGTMVDDTNPSNFCRRGCLDEDGAVQSVSGLRARGIKTIVVGFGADFGSGDGAAVLNGMANAGGWVRRCPTGSECGAGNSCVNGTCAQSFYAPANATELASALADVAKTLSP